MKVPVHVLTGFLGAGKTTLLKTLLRDVQAEGKRAAVLMNEFGKVSVDTLLLENSAVPVVDLIEGCVCCTVKGSLTAAMEQLLAEYQPDVVFLEATGVAIPLEILDALLEQPLSERIEIAGLYALVDATQFPLSLPPLNEQTVIQQTMVEQVRHADVLLLSKTDVARPDRRFALESVLRGFNAKAKMIKCVKGDVDAKVLLEARKSIGAVAASNEKSTKETSTNPATSAASAASAASAKRSRPQSLQRQSFGRAVPTLRAVESKTSFGTLQTFHYSFTAPVDADSFYEFLYALPLNILRAKGFYRDAESGDLYEFHHVPRTPTTARAEGLESLAPFAIFIGEQLDESWLRKMLRSCERPANQ